MSLTLRQRILRCCRLSDNATLFTAQQTVQSQPAQTGGNILQPASSRHHEVPVRWCTTPVKRFRPAPHAGPAKQCHEHRSLQPAGKTGQQRAPVVAITDQNCHLHNLPLRRYATTKSDALSLNSLGISPSHPALRTMTPPFVTGVSEC